MDHLYICICAELKRPGLENENSIHRNNINRSMHMSSMHAILSDNPNFKTNNKIILIQNDDNQESYCSE